MSRTSPRAPQFRGLPPSAIAAIALVLYIMLMPGETRFGAKSRPPAHSGSQSGEAEQHVTEASSAILLDSIVSLVQNYYVDSDRVSGEQLISGTMRSLAYAIPMLRYEENEQSYSLSAETEKLEFSRGGEMAYEEVLGHLKSLIGFGERVKLSAYIGGAENIMLGEEKDPTSLVLNAMLSSLDAHSSLLSSNDYEELRQGTEGAFGGLGVLVGVRENILTVLKPLPKSPALRMGIQKNEKIISIDGFNTYGLSLDKLVPHMRGAPGTVAQLVTLRSGSWAPRTFNLKREIIEVDSVEVFEHHEGNSHILRLAVENFASRTSKEIIENIRKFKKRYPLSGLVLDLRSNPGGLLDQAVLVSDIFLDRGIVVTTRGRREETERAGHTYDEVDYPVVVLMNEDSASASEIVAGALQDNGRALVVGQPSFGKGSVQTVFELPEQRALKLTIARYFTPADKSIQNIGIMPDVWIQPVIRNSENINLLGSYRYRNEQFLPNHLSAVGSADGVRSGPAIKGYYLAKDLTEEASARKIDPEMNIAMRIFEKVNASYGQSLPEGARRASHWLALANSTIKGALAPLSSEAMAWISSTKKVRWKTELNRGVVGPSSLALQIKDSASGLRGVTGGEIEIPWKIINMGSTIAENVSVFIQSPVSGVETSEVLVGQIAGGNFREGILKLKVPSEMKPGRHYVNAGIAVDAQALSNAQGEFLIQVEKQPDISLSVTTKYIDGEASVEDGVLEVREKGVVRIMIKNSGDTDTVESNVSLLNLGGEQIKLSKTEIALGIIKSGETKEVSVGVEGGHSLESPNVSIGVAVKIAKQAERAFAISEIRTSGSLTAARDNPRLSH